MIIAMTVCDIYNNKLTWPFPVLQVSPKKMWATKTSFDHTDCLLPGRIPGFFVQKKETWKLWGTVNIIGDKKDYLGALDCSYIKWYPTFDRAISMIQWIQYNGDQHFRGWMGAILIFCCSKCSSSPLPIQPIFETIIHEHQAVIPMDHCQAYWKLLNRNLLPPWAQHESLTLCTCGVTSSGMATSHKHWEGVLHGEVHPGISSKKNECGQSHRVGFGDILVESGVFFTFISAGSSVVWPQPCHAQPPHGEAPRTVWYCSMVGSWILGVRPSSA